MKLPPFRSLQRSALALFAGAIAGLGFRHCQSGQAVSPSGMQAAAGTQEQSNVTLAAASDARITAAARKWFRSLDSAVEHGRLKQLLPAEIDRIEALTSGELGLWLEEGRRTKVPHPLMDMLMERWGELDRPAFVAWIEMLGKQPRVQSDMSVSYFGNMEPYPPGFTAAVNVLKRLDPDAIPPRANGMIEFMPIGTTVKILSQSPRTVEPPKPDLATLSPDEAMRWLASHVGNFQELNAVVDRLAKTDLDTALAWAEAMPRHLRERREALQAILSKGGEDGEWLLQHVHLLLKEDDMKYALTNSSKLYGTPAGRKSVMEWALQRERKEERAAGLSMLADRMPSNSPEEAVSLLGMIGDRAERDLYLTAMLKRFGGRDDREKLLTLIESEPGTGRESFGAASAAQHLAEKKSVKAAIEWADSLPADGRRAAAYAGAWSAWARQDADAAAAAVLVLPAGAERTAAAASVAGVRGARFPLEALEWSRTLSPPERAGILPILAEGLRQHHAGEAREEAVQILRMQPAAANEPAFQKAVLGLMPETGTASGTKAAMLWLDKVPAGPLRRDLIAALQSAVHGAPAEVTAWLEKQPASERPEPGGR